MGRHRVIGGSPPVALSFETSAVVGPLGTSPRTLSSVDVGAAGKRHVILGCFWTSSAGATVSPITIGGVTATLIQGFGTSAGRLELWSAFVPTGTTANIVITFSGSVGNFTYAIWAAYNVKSLTAIDTVGQNNVTGDTLTSKPRGAAFTLAHGVCAFDQSPTNYSITGMTLDAQPSISGPPNRRMMFASTLTPLATLTYSTAPFSNSISGEIQISASIR